MDLTKAQRLLNKIQAFLDNGSDHELSRLEKDLIKSYVQQLYEAVTNEDHPTQKESHNPIESSFQKTLKSEPLAEVDDPPTRITEMPKTESFKPVYSEYTPLPKQESQSIAEFHPPVYKEKTVEIEETKAEVYRQPVVETKPLEVHTPPPLKQEPVVKNDKPLSDLEQNDALLKLFDLQKSDDMGNRFGHVPIASIESAMGLNERIFTLNELFGGDKGLFDAWCTKLNGLNSFPEAKDVLREGPAKDFKWSDPERIKMAEQFLRIVSRRYPKSGS